MKNRYDICAGSIVLSILCLFSFTSSAFGSASPQMIKPFSGRVLILNSYHPGYAWSEKEQSTIIDALKQYQLDHQPAIEYLDYKRYPGGEHLKELLALFSKKYKNTKFDLLVALDDPALDFTIRHHAALFGRAPIVFCGVSNFSHAMLAGNDYVTGVASVADLIGTIEVMLHLHPHTREIFIIHDYTAAGLAVGKELEAVLPRFTNQVKFRFSKNLPVEAIVRELEKLPQDNLVLLLNYASDNTGRTFDVPEMTRLFSNHSTVPVYGHAEVKLGEGIVGGKLISPSVLAGEAAKLMVRILQGEDASSLPVVTKSTATFMFDHQQMERFQIPPSSLPPNSIVINQPKSFYAANRNLIMPASAIIAIMFLIICLMIVGIIQGRRSALALSKSEARYYDLYENAPDMYFSVDAKTAAITECNKTFSLITGYSKEELLGRSLYDLYHPDCRQEATISLQQFSVSGGIINAERQILCKDGRKIDVSLNASAVRDKSGAILATRSIWRDITDRKIMEAELKNLAITDTLTGAYNRRGFIALAEQQLKQAARRKRGMVLLFADLDNLKQINDTSGHKIGDEAIIEAINVFQEVFRKMDIIARVGGDEFAVLIPDASLEFRDIIKNRLQEQLDIHNAADNRAFTISLSIGIAYYDPEHPISLDDLMARADSLMYEEKMAKRL